MTRPWFPKPIIDLINRVLLSPWHNTESAICNSEIAVVIIVLPPSLVGLVVLLLLRVVVRKIQAIQVFIVVFLACRAL